MNVTSHPAPTPIHPASPVGGLTNGHSGIQQTSDGRLYRVKPQPDGVLSDGITPRYKAGGIRRCDASGNFIPRERESKKLRVMRNRMSRFLADISVP